MKLADGNYQRRARSFLEGSYDHVFMLGTVVRFEIKGRCW